jgi:hypothetical protein
MPIDPFVPASLDEAPRQEPNLAPGSHMPPSRSWKADRPGDLGAMQPKGALLGSPGPNVGYALRLANRVRDRMKLEPHEEADDAIAVIAAIAMKRSATFGRAPTVNDVDFAMELLGYAGDAPEDVRNWRPDVVRAAAHDYIVRRAVVDTVSTGLLRLAITELPEHLAIVREAMARAAVEGEAAEVGEDVDVGELEAEAAAEIDAAVAEEAPEPAPPASDATE